MVLELEVVRRDDVLRTRGSRNTERKGGATTNRISSRVRPAHTNRELPATPSHQSWESDFEVAWLGIIQNDTCVQEKEIDLVRGSCSDGCGGPA
jgi:hypothetical protein